MITYFYFMSAVGPGPGRVPLELFGTMVLRSTDSRYAIYSELRDQLCTNVGCDRESLTVRDFVFEPDAVGA